ncbi:protein trichome birefringence-like 19 [Salvia miltiorrhiza]|uniref:protein trichome birefringence-like 19 n=1 Tax=Salvia miltiorrhiza TaxID=226208 RepID=UPI0025AD6CDB|nr:protein trichome birefringence-like 19 [Salvia miltiorrhiza]
MMKSQMRKKSRKLAPIAALTLLLSISLYLSFIGDSSHHKLPQTLPSHHDPPQFDQCDLFSGEWVPNPDAPCYTNETCYAIQEHQNCLKFGRPDTGYLKWRWKPDACDLPLFQPDRFLQLMRGKSLAFVGDSVSRNHMQSLICLLSKVALPKEFSESGKQIWHRYREHDFNISIFWTPFLVKTGILDPSLNRPFDIYLDEFDDTWSDQIANFDYVILSAGHWFFRPSYLYLNRRLHGCVYCPEPDSNITHLAPSFAFRRAFRTALRAINEAAGYGGVTFVRTFAPSHFEGGAWDQGGNCLRTEPFRRNETALEERFMEIYAIQLEELGIARRAERRNGGRYVLFDTTKPMLLRPDGHPSKYGHLPGAKLVMPNDCVHWCLPGPIDAWSDFLQELLRREMGHK